MNSLGKLIRVALVAAIVSLTGVSVASAQAGEDPAKVAAGEETYSRTCASCHSADGTGTATGRPLTGIADQEPDRNVHITSVTEGIGFMPAYGTRLSEEEIDNVVAYVRATFSSAQEETELPRTGGETTLVVIGFALLTAGATLARLSPRKSPIGES